MDSVVHGPASCGLCGFGLGTVGSAALSFGPGGGRGARLVRASSRLRLWQAPGGYRTQDAVAWLTGTRGRGSFGRATGPVEPGHHALAAQLQGADRLV